MFKRMFATAKSGKTISKDMYIAARFVRSSTTSLARTSQRNNSNSNNFMFAADAILEKDTE